MRLPAFRRPRALVLISFLVLAFGTAVSGVRAAFPEPKGDLYIVYVGVDGNFPASADDINAQDALRVRQALAAGESFYRKVHSRALLGTEGNRPAVLETLEWLAQSVGPDDVAVVFFACHGGPDGKELLISLSPGRAPAPSKEFKGLRGSELMAGMERIKGRPVLLIDTCYSGLLFSSTPGPQRVAVITSCEAGAESGSQLQRFDRPAAFYVIALCEALSGLADANHDRVVTLREVADYLPGRARAFYDEQRAMVALRPEAESIPLARVSTIWPAQELLTAPLRRNPFGWPDVPNPNGGDVHKFAATVKLEGGPTDPNAAAWVRTPVAATDSLEGRWASRWSMRATAERWNTGTAEVRCIGDRVYILFRHEGGTIHLIDAVREGADRLVGRYYDPLRPGDSTPWAGRIVSSQRIDGEWDRGRWDFRRVFTPGTSE